MLTSKKNWPREPRTFWALLALLGMMGSGCAYDLTEEPQSPPTSSNPDAGVAAEACIPGQTVFCGCADGAQGVMTCGSGGSYGVCDCGVDVGPPDAAADAGDAGGLDAQPPTWSVTCETDRYWDNYEDDGRPRSSDQMEPGGDCIGCHTDWGEGPRLEVAGTVFLGLHDDDGCFGADGVVVRVTGSDGRVHDLRTNRTGNFLAETEDLRIAVPYTATVVGEAGERAMLTPQTDLSCNSCHTVAGLNGAPGRIQVPAGDN